jgi:hypothetical protein
MDYRALFLAGAMTQATLVADLPPEPPQNSMSGITHIDNNPQHRWSKTIAQLKRLRSLEANWDSDGAEAPFPEIVDSIDRLVYADKLNNIVGSPEPTEVVALRDGSVALDWAFPQDTFVTLRFDSPYKAQLIVSVPGAKPITMWLDYSTGTAVEIGRA